MLHVLCCFFSRKRLHTRCALVTGFQTCALPILKKAAIDLKQHLADIGLTSFAMLSGSKVVLNEFVAFIDLGKVQGDMSLAAVAIATFALCGFANFKIGRASCRERVGQ